MPTRTLITTDDGSPSLYHTELGETYHSRHGAVQESMHVFIHSGMDHRQSLSLRALSVLEIGFGTGLNAALAVQHATQKEYPLTLVSIEKYPLTRDEETAFIAHSPEPVRACLEKVIAAPWNETVALHPLVQLTKIEGDATTTPLPSCDVLFLDAFAPAVSPELWTPHMMAQYANSLRPGGLLVTYCAKGEVRRAMESAGLITERLPGPPGKREMLRATKPLQSPHAQ
jgi:tRNA U34 5-methylaminomethyl-2-thiouridine-forming methyltransferase MnmC